MCGWWCACLWLWLCVCVWALWTANASFDLDQKLNYVTRSIGMYVLSRVCRRTVLMWLHKYCKRCDIHRVVPAHNDDVLWWGVVRDEWKKGVYKVNWVALGCWSNGTGPSSAGCPIVLMCDCDHSQRPPNQEWIQVWWSASKRRQDAARGLGCIRLGRYRCVCSLQCRLKESCENTVVSTQTLGTLWLPYHIQIHVHSTLSVAFTVATHQLFGSFLKEKLHRILLTIKYEIMTWWGECSFNRATPARGLLTNEQKW